MSDEDPQDRTEVDRVRRDAFGEHYTIVSERTAAAAEAIWADLGDVDPDYDATADVRAMRDEDNAISEANDRARLSGEYDPEAAGALLRAVGLDEQVEGDPGKS